MPSLLANLNLIQNRIATLQDILQDTLYLAENLHLPLCNRNDLKRAIEDTESVFYNLATIRSRLERTHPHLQP